MNRPYQQFRNSANAVAFDACPNPASACVGGRGGLAQTPQFLAAAFLESRRYAQVRWRTEGNLRLPVSIVPTRLRSIAGWNDCFRYYADDGRQLDHREPHTLDGEIASQLVSFLIAQHGQVTITARLLRDTMAVIRAVCFIGPEEYFSNLHGRNAQGRGRR